MSIKSEKSMYIYIFFLIYSILLEYKKMWREKVVSLSFIFISLSAKWQQLSIMNWIIDEI